MQSPVDAIMGTSGPASDLVKRVTGQETPGRGFDEQLQSVMESAPKAQRTMKEKARSAKGGMKVETKEIVEDPKAAKVFEYMAALRSLGLNTEDSRKLLTGQGEISDEGLCSVLKSMGITGSDLARLMASPELVSGLKSSIAQSVFSSAQSIMEPVTASVTDDELMALMSAGGLDDAQVEQFIADPAKLAQLKASLADVAPAAPGAATDGGIPDDQLKTLLAAFGMNDDDIAGFMANQEGVSGLKAKLAEVLAGGAPSLPGTTIPDVSTMLERFDTLNALMAQFIASKSFRQGIAKGLGTPGIEAIKAAITQDASAIKESVSAYLIAQGRTELPSEAVRTAVPDEAANVPQAVQAAQAAKTLQDTLNIPKKTLNDMVFSSDPEERLAAVDDAASHINEYLKTNAPKELPKHLSDAVGLLKGALTEDEFAKIENIFKANGQDPALTVQGTPFDRHALQSLAKAFGSEQSSLQNTYTQQVMDQIRQAFPSGIKASDSSMTLRLNPPMLGRVDVDITLQDGKILATFKADQSVTREILQQNMHLLKDALSDQGVKAAQFVVSTDSFNARDQRETYAAWAGFEQGRRGSSRQNHDPGAGSGGRDHDEYVPGYGTSDVSPLGGGLHIIA